MEKKEKKNYEVPGLTVVTFKAERGYGASSGDNAQISGNKYQSSDLNENYDENPRSYF